MTRDQFAKLFEAYRENARRVVLAKFSGDAALADDAIQDAAVYVLEHLARFKKLTPSYFRQLVVSRALNHLRGDRRRQARTVSVGDAVDLVRIEYDMERRRRGRVPPHPSSDKQFENVEGGGDRHPSAGVVRRE